MRMPRKPILWILLSVWSGPIALPAQNPQRSSPKAFSLEQRLAVLEQALLRMETRLEALERAAPAMTNPAALRATGEALGMLKEGALTLAQQRPSSASPSQQPETRTPFAEVRPVVNAGPDGFSVQSADGRFQLKPQLRLAADGAFTANGNGNPSLKSFYIRRAQVFLDGTLSKYFSFRFLPNFARGQITLSDAYGEFAPSAAIKVRAGKFKSPLGLELLMGGSNLPLAERSLVTRLVPNRDQGLQVYGVIRDGSLEYAAAILNGVRDGGSSDADAQGGKDFVGRLFFRPFRFTEMAPLHALGLGVAGSVGNSEGNVSEPDLPSLQTSSQRIFFHYGSGPTESDQVVADGQRFRVSPQGSFYWQNVGLISEYVLSSQEIRRGSQRQTITNRAWQVTGTYLLSKDKASPEGVVPARPFDPQQHHWGAFELAARYSELHVDKATFPFFADPEATQGARAWALGLNWYFNKNVKLVLNYEQTDFFRTSLGKRLSPERLFLERIQLKF